MNSFKTLNKYIIRYKWYLIVGVVTLIIVDIAQLFIPRIIKYAIDAITKGGITRGDLLYYAIRIVVLISIVTFFRFFWRYFIMGTSRKIEMHLRDDLFSHFTTLGLNFFSKRKVGDLMAHATNDIEAVRQVLGMGMIQLIDILVLGPISLVFMLLISPKLTLYVSIPFPIVFFVVFRFGKLIYLRFKEVQASFSNLTANVRESMESIQIIKAYNQEGGEIQKFKNSSQQYVNKNIKLIQISSIFHPMIFFFASISMVIALGVGGKLAISKAITMGDFVAFQAYLGTFIWPVIAIGMIINLLQRGAASMERINKLLNTVPETQGNIRSSSAQFIGTSRQGGTVSLLTISDLSFSYNGTKVLKKINLTLKKGETLGIAGPVGSGKSTLVNLILNLFPDYEGEIKIDDVPAKNIPLNILRRRINLVPQDTFLFSDTIRENIAFGSPSANENIVIESAKLAELYDEVMDFPQKLDEIIGERGVTLSGGQCQRVAIARAILTSPDILILDNALSSVDIEKEIKILSNLKELFKDKMLIVISHRIRSIADFNKIMFLENGEIKESGTHRELLTQQGLYFNLFKQQELVGE